MPTGDDADLDTPELVLLWAARETGLLDALLTSVGTATEAAALTGVSERAARVAVDALVGLDLFRRVDEEVEPTNRALGFLATEDVRSIGRLPHAVDVFARYRDLPTAMRGGTATEPPENAMRHELGARAAVDDGTVRACADAVHAANPEAHRVLELCGGPGRYARELTDRGVDVTLLEGPEVVDAVAPSLASTGVTLTAGSLTDLRGAAFDLVYAVDVAWSFSREENAMLVEAAAAALAGHGTLVLVEPLRGHSEAAVETAVRALSAGAGECYAEADVAGWCFAAGLTSLDVADVPGTPLQAVAASRMG